MRRVKLGEDDGGCEERFQFDVHLVFGESKVVLLTDKVGDVETYVEHLIQRIGGEMEYVEKVEFKHVGVRALVYGVLNLFERLCLEVRMLDHDVFDTCTCFE